MSLLMIACIIFGIGFLIVICTIAIEVHTANTRIKNLKYGVEMFMYAQELARKDEKERFTWIAEKISAGHLPEKQEKKFQKA